MGAAVGGVTGAIVGGIADDAVPAYGLGVDAMFSIDRAALPFPESAPRSAADYRATLRDVLRVWQLGRVGHSRWPPPYLLRVKCKSALL